MTQLTLAVPDDLASCFQSLENDEIPRVLALGLRRSGANGSEFEGLSDVLEMLASLPTPQEVLAMRPSPALAERIARLLEKNRREGLSPEERRWWEQFAFVEHLVRMAKAKAALMLQETV